MIDYNKLEFSELGEVILQKEPLLLCEKKELEKRVANRDMQNGFWKELLDDWEQKGIIKTQLTK